MLREQRLVYVAHCILNQNTVVRPLARAKGAYRQIVETILEHDVAIEQLPCPEMIAQGLQRVPMEKKDYDTPAYRVQCKELAIFYRQQMEMFRDDGVKILGMIGIHESPTCSIEQPVGLFMEYLKEENIPYLQVPTEYIEGTDQQEFLREVHRFCEKETS